MLRRFEQPSIAPQIAQSPSRGRLWILQLVAAELLLSWCVSVRWPAATPLRDWLAPSADIAALLALLALLAPRPGWLLPRAILAPVCLWLVLVRAGRIADGVCRRFLDRSFHVASDLTLVPEFVRLAYSTLGPLMATLAIAAWLASLCIVWLLAGAALRVLAHTLSERRAGDLYLVAAALLAALSALSPAGRLYAGSVAPRVATELELWLSARGLFDDPEHVQRRRAFTQRFSEHQQQLTAAPIPTLHPAPDVHVILVEAYGATVQSTPQYAQVMAPGYQDFAQRVSGAGFAVCSSFVQATVLGGNSWLTHATLETGAPMVDHFDYMLLLERTQISSLAKKFGAAGYHTVSVKPGTTRDSPQTRMYGFDREYAARDFGYRGPSYSWAPMPDQFVLQTIAEHELRAPSGPLFLEYALVSSHFPFNPHPAYVDDWASLGDGSMYFRQEPVQFGASQGELNPTVLGYLTSLLYDLRSISEFLARYVRGDALVLVLGDHQPIAPVAGDDHSFLTPLHVISRSPELLRQFQALGCTPGMIAPRPDGVDPLKMEDLGLRLLTALNVAAAMSGGVAP
jgi:hypothetical protein